MKITIAERLHPFSHGPGTKFLIPRTTWTVQVFPTRLNFYDLEGVHQPFFLTFDFLGPVRGFTAEMDLERGHLSVFGMTQKGFMRYQLCAKEDGIHLTMEKVPEERVMCGNISLAKGESILVRAYGMCLVTPIQERLSLGMHKAQDWDLVRRRLDCKEIFPAWFLMASQTPVKVGGENSLLEACRRKIEQRDKESLLEAFEHLFLAAFEGVLAPRSSDTDHQGIAAFTSSFPLPFLTESGRLIRSLFIQENEGAICLLPCLPPQFHCGRMTGVRTSSGGVLHFEWTKKALRRVLVDPVSEGEIHLKLPKGIRSFRMSGGKKVDVDAEGRASLFLEAGKTVQLDRFEY